MVGQRAAGFGRRAQRPDCPAVGLGSAAAVCQLPGVRSTHMQDLLCYSTDNSCSLKVILSFKVCLFKQTSKAAALSKHLIGGFGCYKYKCYGGVKTTSLQHPINRH